MIVSRRAAEKKVEKNDLFSLLLDANEDEGQTGEAVLSDQDMIGALDPLMENKSWTSS